MVVLQMLNFYPYFYRLQTKLREGIVLTNVCHSVRGEVWSKREGGDMVATEADGTHPTEMHSCL